jgi:maltokinase
MPESNSLPATVPAELVPVVSTYATRRTGWGAEAGEARVVEAVQLRRGRPGLLDVVATVGRRLVHVPLGLRQAGSELQVVGEGDNPVLGTVDDGDGPAVCFDALRDGETSALLLAHVSGSRTDPSLVRQVRMEDASVTMAMEDRFAFTVYNELLSEPRPEVDVLFALDEAGFNHLAAPLCRWRRGQWDLGVVQEHLLGPSSGWALALTSVRDLYASGGPPELAGGDFGTEAHRLGTMAARLHLALEQAYGRRPAEMSRWADAVEQAVATRQPMQAERPEVVALLGELRALPAGGVAIRTHGDFHLGRVWRAEQGWYVGDLAPGGWPPPAAEGPLPPMDDHEGIAYRSPLADVADMMWSFGHVAASAASERDPTGSEGLGELGAAWEQRNRRAFLAGYLGVPGIASLVPTSREHVRILVSALELERASRASAQLTSAS